MNWLAHCYLSDPDPAVRIGNLLPDILSYSQLANLPGEFQRGIQLHRRIDAFTDAHPVVKQSIRRIGPPYRRYAGVLVDVFYDHVLAREWSAYSQQPLPEFVAGVYRSFEILKDQLPPEVWPRLESMRHSDLLGSYRELSGIAAALERVSHRLRRHIHLAGSVTILEKHYPEFRADFEKFFPELCAHVLGGGAKPERCS